MQIDDATLLSIFERTFRGGVSGCRRRCECGVEYWDTFNKGYTWDEGEIEKLEAMQADGRSKPLDHSVGVIEFEGRYYVDGCSCWHVRAIRIGRWILAHDRALADFLRERKTLLERVASNAAIV